MNRWQSLDIIGRRARRLDMGNETRILRIAGLTQMRLVAHPGHTAFGAIPSVLIIRGGNAVCRGGEFLHLPSAGLPRLELVLLVPDCAEPRNRAVTPDCCQGVRLVYLSQEIDAIGADRLG